jgi:hypothetical protein
MNLSISQMQNVLRTYQNQVREEKVKAVLGSRETSPGWQDRVDISQEGRSRLEDGPRGIPTPAKTSPAGNNPCIPTSISSAEPRTTPPTS